MLIENLKLLLDSYFTVVLVNKKYVKTFTPKAFFSAPSILNGTDRFLAFFRCLTWLVSGPAMDVLCRMKGLYMILSNGATVTPENKGNLNFKIKNFPLVF